MVTNTVTIIKRSFPICTNFGYNLEERTFVLCKEGLWEEVRMVTVCGRAAVVYPITKLEYF